jgi:hypothetical protein
MGRQVVIAIMLVGMIIGSAIAASSIGLGGLVGGDGLTVPNGLRRLYHFDDPRVLLIVRLLWQWFEQTDT